MAPAEHGVRHVVVGGAVPGERAAHPFADPVACDPARLIAVAIGCGAHPGDVLELGGGEMAAQEPLQDRPVGAVARAGECAGDGDEVDEGTGLVLETLPGQITRRPAEGGALAERPVEAAAHELGQRVIA